jgi:hypothetical protein
MALADPQTITISGVTTPLPRVDTSVGSSKYLSADGLIDLSLANAYGRRTRRVVRVDHSKITTDPFISTQNVKVGMSVYTVFDLPPAGYTNAEALAVYTGFKTQLAASSDLVITKLLGGES